MKTNAVRRRLARIVGWCGLLSVTLSLWLASKIDPNYSE